MKIILFVTSALLAVGCSTLSTEVSDPQLSRGGELRGGAPIRANHAEALMSGPVLIRHLDTGGNGTVILYLADARDDDARSCESAIARRAAPLAILVRSNRISQLAVPRGKRLCAAVTDARSMDVTWHAEATPVEESRKLAVVFAQTGPHR